MCFSLRYLCFCPIHFQQQRLEADVAYLIPVLPDGIMLGQDGKMAINQPVSDHSQLEMQQIFTYMDFTIDLLL
jgi:hypothetical protein